MNARTTWIWIGLAAVLFAVIFALEKFSARPPSFPTAVLPGFKAATATSIQMQGVGAMEVLAERSSNSWKLVRPVTYPANTAAIQGLLAALEKLAPAHIISASELRTRTNADAEFGLLNPRASIVLKNGEERRLRVGALTAPGDQVYVQVVGQEGVFIVDAEWLSLLPKAAEEWRDASLVDFSTFDFTRVSVSNANGVIDLQYGTNRLWTLTRSMARADGERMTRALRDLLSTQVTRFVSDSTNADVESFGLQPPALEITFSVGTNVTEILQFGKTVSTNDALCYARRPLWNAILAVPQAGLAAWRVSAQEFRDLQLLAVRKPVDEIEFKGAQPFTLQRTDTNQWRVAGSDMSVDALWTQQIVSNIAALKIGFVKDAVTPLDLPKWGLDVPVTEIILRSAVTNGVGLTNMVMGQLAFGTNRDGLIYVRRADEVSSVYGVPLADFHKLPASAWRLRERHIWNFSNEDVSRITVQRGDRSWSLVHKGTNAWEFQPPPRTPPNEFALEEIAGRLGGLFATLWVEKNVSDPARFGFGTNSFTITAELKSGRKQSFQLGALSESGYPLALVTVDGEPWVCELDLGLYELFQFYVVKPFDPSE